MNKRGQGISINVIVIAAIALLILVILSVMVIRGIGPAGETCTATGGTCEADYGSTTCEDIGKRTDLTGQCPKSTSSNPLVCCRPII